MKRQHRRFQPAASAARRLALPSAVFAATLAFAVPLASAANIHLFEETFGSAAQPSFSEATALAVEQSSGNVLVVDAAAGTISRFNEDGSSADFAELGTNVIDGEGGADLTPQEGLAFDSPAKTQIAVDDSGTATDGNIYVTQPLDDLIDIFSSDGAYLGQLSAAGGTAFEAPCGVTVDSAGAVYVGDEFAGIHRFSPAANPPVNGDHTATFDPIPGRWCALAAGAGPTGGSLFGVNGELFKLDASTGAVDYPVEAYAQSESYSTVAVDPESGHVFGATAQTTNRRSILQFDASGSSGAVRLDNIARPRDVLGLAVRGSSGEIYASREVSDTIEVLEPTIAVWAEGVLPAEATLKARIDPEGEATTYRFEWGTDTSYGNTSGEIALGSAAEERTVSLRLEGLLPDTTYHFRAVATGETHVLGGQDQSFTTHVQGAPPGNCLNRELREGLAANLPDCRAYEMVSPLEKNGGDIVPPEAIAGYISHKQASPEGDRLTYSAEGAFGDAVAAVLSNQYLSSRGAAGWSTQGISPRRHTQVYDLDLFPAISWIETTLWQGFSDGLCSGWVKDANEVPLTADALEGYVNLYRRDNCGPDPGGYEALTYQGPFGPATKYLNDSFGEAPAGRLDGLKFEGASADLRHQVFMSSAALTPDAVPGVASQLYDLHDGELELVSVLPGGEANPGYSYLGTFHGAYLARSTSLENAVSTDASRIFWTSRPGGQPSASRGPGSIFVRVDGETTLAVSEEGESLIEERLGGAAQGSQYWTAAADGSRALFSTGTSSSGLVRSEDLYLFDVEAALGGEEATTLVAQEVQGVLGASEDLSRIYFVSTEALGEGAQAGDYNLYLSEDGVVRLVAVLSEDDVYRGPSALVGLPIGPISPYPLGRAARVTPDGGKIAFQSYGGLTAYDNLRQADGRSYSEVYRYSAATGRLSCVSCMPSGEAPSGGPPQRPYNRVGRGQLSTGGSQDSEAQVDRLAEAASLPTWENRQHGSRVLSEDGNRVFFHSREALVPGDSNGVRDVYQWEAPGTGTCAAGAPGYSAQNEGCIHLISTGKSTEASEFYDASADGDDVFFSTASSLDPRDPGLVDVYDARVNGGFSLPPEPEGCVGDGCHSSADPPSFPAPSSAAIHGGSTLAGEPLARCRPPARRAKRLSQRAKRLQRGARRAAGRGGRARPMRRRARRIGKRAQRLSRSAKRCRARVRRQVQANANRRAGQ